MDERQPFEGFLPPISSTTYCPNQFFDVVLRRGSRGAIRLVAYLIRKTLGWSDASGRPQSPQAMVSWRELENRAGVGHSSIASALRECIDARYITCTRPGRPDRAGEASESALYELRWDDGDGYVTDPDRFVGFYAGNGNLTHIPNQYFDLVVPTEPLAVLRIVGAIIRHTIGFQTRYGFRRQEVRMSHGALQRYTDLSHEAVRLGVQAAVARRYIVCREPGVFDTNAGRTSSPAVYGIRWRDAWNGECSRRPEEPTDLEATASTERRSTPSEPLRNTVRERSGNLHGRRSERLQGTETTENNTSKQQQALVGEGRVSKAAVGVSSDACSEPVSESSPAFGALIDAGFDSATARRLAAQHSVHQIARQCAWLPRRNPHRNRLGLLRKAIEEDWPEPPEQAPGQSAAAELARAYYTAVAGSQAAGAMRPSAEDLAQAAGLMDRIEHSGLGIPPPMGWGTDFAAHVRRQSSRPRVSQGSLAHAIASFGEDYLSLVQERQKKAQRRDLVAARRRHQAEHQEAYLAYLRACRDRLRREQPDAYRAFEEAERRRREELQDGFVARVGLTDRMLIAFDRREEQLTRFWLFFSKRPEFDVLDFWSWDARHNPHALAAAPPVQASDLDSLPTTATGTGA